MKKTLFIMSILIISGVLIYMSFLNEQQINNNKELEDILSSKQETYVFDNNKKQFIKTISDKYDKEQIFYKKINQIDGVYFFSKSVSDININNNDGKVIININKGLYLFVLNDVFTNYEINSENLNIKSDINGIFLLNNFQKNEIIYNYNALLQLDLIYEKKRITSFKLFPSLIFKYDPKFNTNLKSADILRVSTVNSIYYLDSKNDDFFKNLFGGDNNDGFNFLSNSIADFNNKIKIFNKHFNQVVFNFKGENLKGEDLKGEDLIYRYPMLFINNVKKDSFIKNNLIKNTIGYLKNIYQQDNLNKESEQNIINLINNLKNIGEDSYNEGIDIIKNYYYLSYFYGTAHNKLLLLKQTKLIDFVAKVLNKKEIIENNKNIKQISEIYFDYNFGNLEINDLYNFFNDYLIENIKSKTIKNEQYDVLLYFLGQYVDGNIEHSKEVFKTLIYLFNITNSYYDLIKDKTKIANIVPINYFNFSKILSKLNNMVLKNYFIKDPKGFILKDEYSPKQNKKLFPDDVLLTLKSIYSFGTKYQSSIKAIFYSLISNYLGQTKDNYVVLEEKFKTLSNIIYIIDNYSDYILKIKLNEQSKDLKGLNYDENKTLTKEYLLNYLSQFNNLDLESLKILNNYEVDNFYEVSVNILNNNFKFKLKPEGNIVFDLIFSDSSGVKNESFFTLPVSFDEKIKSFQEKCKDGKDLLKQYKCDFKNIFEIIYLTTGTDQSNNDIEVNNEEDNLINKMPVELQLFVQNELIEKDFKNISNFFNIGFKNIFAQIKDGEYNIDIININKNFNYKESSYIVEISGKYIFKRHSFYNLKLKIKQEKNYLFDGKEIIIKPSLIFVKDIEGKLQNLGDFIYYTNLSYYQSYDNIIFNLNTNKISLDNDTFNINLQ